MPTRRTQNMVATSGDNDLMTLFNQAYPAASRAANPATMAQDRPTVDQMSVRDRFWDSMNYTYGQQRRASDQSYENAISQQDRQALARGMQRSSYNAATQANLRNQQIEAQNNIWAQQIADYERQLYQMERDEIADQQWQTQFDESVRQFNVLHPQPVEGAGGGGGGGSSSSGSGRGRSPGTGLNMETAGQIRALNPNSPYYTRNGNNTTTNTNSTPTISHDTGNVGSGFVSPYAGFVSRLNSRYGK